MKKLCSRRRLRVRHPLNNAAANRGRFAAAADRRLRSLSSGPRSRSNGTGPRRRGLGGSQGRDPNPSARAAHGPAASTADPTDDGGVPPGAPAPGGAPVAPDPHGAPARGHRLHGRVSEPLPPQGELRSLKLARTAVPYSVISCALVVDFGNWRFYVV